MNLADYLSELLGIYDEVSVPGLGYFVREHVSGYYSDREAKFYPPYHKVKFVPELREDDTFAQYVADKKNISLASSKYFAEKFISKLREDAALGKYAFADLGTFQTGPDQQLVFKPLDRMPEDPSFYGYPPLNISKLAQPAPGGDIKHIYAEPVSAPVVIPPSVPVMDSQQYYEEETERKRGGNIWLILLIALTIIALAVFGIYKFYPAAFNKVTTAYHNMRAKKEDTAHVYRQKEHTDTTNKIVPVVTTDTSAKSTAIIPSATTQPVAVADTGNQSQGHFYVILRRKYVKMNDAISELKSLRAKRIDAHILSAAEAPGPLYKISFRTCNTQSQADAVMLDLVNEGKINKDLQIIP